ncbi:hypothetical protein VMCG_10648 [Cytospora schulzeri]|uniref:Uncharacterized protein n=1 Tax=Cytospora schulzeri TaxID=448051 RepID=A0A423VB92_9PEZI|nr:hypothetical protein VMCG_10648 [Valsa malicola]
MALGSCSQHGTIQVVLLRQTNTLSKAISACAQSRDVKMATRYTSTDGSPEVPTAALAGNRVES